MTRQDRQEFNEYLSYCTNAQVQGVYDKEASASRWDYANLAVEEAMRRGIVLLMWSGAGIGAVARHKRNRR